MSMTATRLTAGVDLYVLWRALWLSSIVRYTNTLTYLLYVYVATTIVSKSNLYLKVNYRRKWDDANDARYH